ncbi:MAG TPA: class F sortase [Actinomycetota bacterium]|nr:class F sortase [Actinomycetota bacterium]
MVERRWLVRAGRALPAALFGVAGGVALFMAAGDQQPSPPVVPGVGWSAAPSSTALPRPQTSPVSPSVADNADPLVGPILPAAEPAILHIPRIGVRSDLVRLGLDSAGAMEVPGEPGVAGWYTKAPTPGALGPAVIAGHLTWDGAPAIFVRLGDLRPGDRVEVLRQDGRTAIFAIRRVVRVAKSRFPTHAVYGPTDHAALRLITCAGRYDDDGFADNIVVFAAMADVREP